MFEAYKTPSVFKFHISEPLIPNTESIKKTKTSRTCKKWCIVWCLQKIAWPETLRFLWSGWSRRLLYQICCECKNKNKRQTRLATNMHPLYVVPFNYHIVPHKFFLIITRTETLLQLEQFHSYAFLIGEVETLDTTMGIIGGDTPPIMYTIHQISCPIYLILFFNYTKLSCCETCLWYSQKNQPFTPYSRWYPQIVTPHPLNNMI